MQKPQGKLKANRVLLDTIIFLSWVNPEIKAENVIPFYLTWTIPDESFTTFPEALINSEAKILSTFNALYITLTMCLSNSFNAEYVSTGT